MKWMLRMGLVLVAAMGLSLLLKLGQAQTAKGESHALLVGVRTYDHSAFDNLRYTENDVEKLAELLDRPGSPFHKRVRVLTCTRGEKNRADKPTAANIRKALEQLVSERSRHDTILVALAGHGVELQVADPESKKDDRYHPFFCPTDSQLLGTNYTTGTNARMINLKHMMETLGDCGAGKKLVLMDACRNEMKARGMARSLKVKGEMVPDGVSVLFGCRSGEKAFESAKLKHGVFFHFVLEGLRGEARNKEGELTWDDLTAYAKRQVSKNVESIMGDGANQTPHLVSNLAGEAILLPPGAFARVAPPVKKEDKPGVKDDKVAKEIENSIGMKLVYVPAGKFTMGSPVGEEGRDKNETEHEVEITKGFYMGVHEVTQGEWEEVMGKGTNPSCFSATGGGKGKVEGMDTTRFPVEQVSWQDAQDFLKKLNARAGEKKFGLEYRLPSEAQWEYTARRGYLKESKETDPFSFGKSLSSTQANFHGDFPYGGAAKGPYLARTCKVGSYAANGLGIHDMHGNVYEWCADWSDEKYYANSPRQDPPGPQKGSARVFRGGGWSSNGQYCRSAFRYWNGPTLRDFYLGFRVLAVPSKQE